MMIDIKIDVINYLDVHAVVQNRKITPLSIQKLKDKFTQMDVFTLRLWQKEWIEAREAMLNIEI